MPEETSEFYSTHLNSRIDTIEKLATRNLRMLGCPLIKLELAQDMAFEAISKAVELYTQYTEPDREFLLFDSTIYTPGVGIKMDTLFVNTPETNTAYDPTDPNTQVGKDYDLMDWRRVIDVVNVEEGENQGTNILFTMQYAMVQQMGALMHSGGLNKGFDMVTWYNMNEFLEMRNKMLALKTFSRFDPNTQILRLFPEPDVDGKGKYWALVECYLEPRFRDCLKNHFVQSYSLAIMKIMIGNVRGQFNGVNLLGNGTVNYNDILQQGLTEKEKMEEQLLNGTGGFVGGAPPAFLVF
jgi:hypothetical protein